MARDWIQIRVWLHKDPKVIQMADYLAGERLFMDWLTDPVRATCKESAYEHVTRNVTVALCVTGLCVTWGTAREQGDRENDDLILSSCDFDTISAMSDIPCFGDAMGFVGWAIENEDNTVTFPKFFREAESPHERHRKSNAERQARLRERRRNDSNVTRNVTRNVTVTHREEESREEDTPIVPKGTSNNGYCKAFEEWWAAYPRKAGKDAAYRAWKKAGAKLKAKMASDGETVAAFLLKRCREYAAARRTEDPQFTAHPATWLNQGRWDDDQSTWRSKPQPTAQQDNMPLSFEEAARIINGQPRKEEFPL